MKKITVILVGSIACCSYGSEVIVLSKKMPTKLEFVMSADCTYDSNTEIISARQTFNDDELDQVIPCDELWTEDRIPAEPIGTIIHCKKIKNRQQKISYSPNVKKIFLFKFSEIMFDLIKSAPLYKQRAPGIIAAFIQLCSLMFCQFVSPNDSLCLKICATYNISVPLAYVMEPTDDITTISCKIQEAITNFNDIRSSFAISHQTWLSQELKDLQSTTAEVAQDVSGLDFAALAACISIIDPSQAPNQTALTD